MIQAIPSIPITKKDVLQPSKTTCKPCAIGKLRAHHPNHPIKTIRVDNASEYTSRRFHEYCASTGIMLETLKGHWAFKCRTPEFHCKLYQNSLTQQDARDQRGESRGDGRRNQKKTKFMTDFSDDDVECNYADVYNCEAVGSSNECLIDSGTTNAILRCKDFFTELKLYDNQNTWWNDRNSRRFRRGECQATKWHRDTNDQRYLLAASVTELVELCRPSSEWLSSADGKKHNRERATSAHSGGWHTV
jgi:hypothetical protein